MHNHEYLENDLKRIMDLVDFISYEHIKFTQQFLRDKDSLPNLKQTQLRHFLLGSMDEKNVEIDIDFLGYILEYIDKLGQYYTYELVESVLTKEIPHDHIREKNKDSIISKLIHYRYAKEEKGRLSTNKCLNDLLGFRLYIDEINDYDALTEHLKRVIDTVDVNNNRLKFNNSCKSDYKAIHIYFYGNNNKFFPWELQIWDKKYAEHNLHSHKNHKQEYLEWKNYVPDDMIKIIER